MKPRNKFQQKAIEASKKLPPLTPTQERWAYIIAKTRCDENQNKMRFFEGVNSPKRNVTKISHAHEKHRSNGC